MEEYNEASVTYNWTFMSKRPSLVLCSRQISFLGTIHISTAKFLSKTDFDLGERRRTKMKQQDTEIRFGEKFRHFEAKVLAKTDLIFDASWRILDGFCA